jgi:ABC-type polysaccharide/polyol phosphate export permease
MLSLFIFMVPEIVILLLFARIAFGVRVQGSLFAVMIFVFLGAFTFAGVGLLVASRAKSLETVSGLMNLVMLPMWILSGIFFSSERFPAAVQPFIDILPLTPLINALRAVILEGHSLYQLWSQIVILTVWGVLTFALSLRWFRWM